MELNDDFKKSIDKVTEDWALRHPLDYLWRQTFNIPFGSPQHLGISFVDQYRWFKEKTFVKEMIDKNNLEKEGRSSSGSKRYSDNGVDYKKFGFKDEADVDKTLAKFKDREKGTKLMNEMLKDIKWRTR